MAVEDRVQVGRQEIQGGAISSFAGSLAVRHEIEVAAIRRRVGPAHEAGEQRRRTRDVGGSRKKASLTETVQSGKANAQLLVQATSPTRAFTGRTKHDADPAHALDVIGRHCARSIA